MAYNPKTPFLCVDIILHTSARDIVLIERKNPPYGIALPGGFVDIGEDIEAAARRETQEETGCALTWITQFRAYGHPRRDPRFHTCSIVYIGRTSDTPRAADDAKAIRLYTIDAPPPALQFDHGTILRDYLSDLYPRVRANIE